MLDAGMGELAFAIGNSGTVPPGARRDFRLINALLQKARYTRLHSNGRNENSASAYMGSRDIYIKRRAHPSDVFGFLLNWWTGLTGIAQRFLKKE